jgi:hypothetical protein
MEFRLCEGFEDPASREREEDSMNEGADYLAEVSTRDVQQVLEESFVPLAAEENAEGILVPKSYISIGVALQQVAARTSDQSEAVRRHMEEHGVADPVERFTDAGLRLVVSCSNPSSMVSGQWGLGSFTLGGRGYFYNQPDIGVGRTNRFSCYRPGREPVTAPSIAPASYGPT